MSGRRSAEKGGTLGTWKLDLATTAWSASQLRSPATTTNLPSALESRSTRTPSGPAAGTGPRRPPGSRPPATLRAVSDAADGEFSPGREPVLHGEQRGRGAGGDADLGVGVLDVMVGGLDRDPLPTRDLLGLQPRASRPITSASRSVSPAGRSSRGMRRPVRPGLGHRVLGVDGGERARARCDGCGGGSSVVARAVEPLVVEAGHRCQRGQERRAGQDALGMVGVQPDPFPAASASGVATSGSNAPPARLRTTPAANSGPPSMRWKVASRATEAIRTGSGISWCLARPGRPCHPSARPGTRTGPAWRWAGRTGRSASGPPRRTR